MSRTITAVIAVLALAIASTAASASIIPREGHYAGVDHSHHHISFVYTRSRGMQHFTVDHHVIGGAHVSGARWHHTCHNGYCTRASWTKSTTVTGVWNDSHSGHDVAFTVHWVSASS